MRESTRRSSVETPVQFDMDPESAEHLFTGLADLALVSEAFRRLGLCESANGRVQIQECQRGFDEGTYVESLVVLNAAGGDVPG